MGRKIQKNDFVTVEYTGYMENGDIIGSADSDSPLRFQVGRKTVLPGFEKSVLGMEVNEEKVVVLEPEDTFGPSMEELIHTVAKDSLDAGVTPSPGMVIGMKFNKEGKEHQVPATVIEVGDETVTVDFNHPLAGKKLSFKIKVTAIEDGKE
jgi:FKBP-type peptidyl-prolyl cis-trans isomerase 2